MDDKELIGVAMRAARSAITCTQMAASHIDEVLDNGHSKELRPLSNLLWQLSEHARHAEGKLAQVHRNMRKEPDPG